MLSPASDASASPSVKLENFPIPVYIEYMVLHSDIDKRSLCLARSLVEKIDQDPQHGIQTARSVCRRWMARGTVSAVAEWERLLIRPWPAIRAVLLDKSDNGQRLRQSNPFCGILTPRERWAIYKRFASDETQ